MRTAVVVFVGMWIVMSAASAGAVADPNPDRIGIYFDEGADQNILWAGSWPLLTMYVTVTNPTFTSIYGWQAAIRGLDSGTATVLGTTITGGAVINGPDLQYSVAYETPLTAQPVTVLATIVGLMQDSMARSCLILSGIDQPAIPELLPLVWVQPDQPVVIQVSHHYANGVAAAINESPIPEEPSCASAVSVDRTSWRSLKALFR